MKQIIEVEIGFPKSIVQYEGEPTSKLVSTEQLQEELNLQLQQERMYSEKEVRKITLDFFYHWWNSKGTNTEQGFDEWFEEFKNK